MLERIQYTSTTAERTITTIFGLPFYKSSGTSSSAPGTWFPFHGLSDKPKEITEGILPVGWFIKEAKGNRQNQSLIPSDVKWEISDILRYKSDEEFTTDLIGRFNSLPCLLISSVLGGGIWEERKIKNELKPYLMKKYPEFYEAFPAFEFSSEVLHIDFRDKDINKIYQVNQWLIDHSVDDTIKNISDLKRKDLRELKDLEPYKPSATYQQKM